MPTVVLSMLTHGGNMYLVTQPLGDTRWDSSKVGRKKVVEQAKSLNSFYDSHCLLSIWHNCTPNCPLSTWKASKNKAR